MENILSAKISGTQEKRSPLKKVVILELITYLLILLFIYASLRKLLQYSMFVREIYGYSVWLPVKWGIGVLAGLELISAAILSIPRYKLWGFFAAFLTLIVLNVSSFIVLQRAPVIPYYFGGIFPGVSFYLHLLINIVLLFICLVGIFYQLQKSKNNFTNKN